MKRLAIAVLLLAGALRPALGATRRIAIVVGANAGNGSQPPLHYAEADAEKIARVLLELGGIAPADLTLLSAPPRIRVEDALAAAAGKVALWHARGDRVVLLFYFSGHSDGEALELGAERFRFGELRRLLAATSADVRLGIVDTCKAGGLLAAKGGTPAQAFQIRLTDELASTGEVLLTSSAADEVALESKQIGGSFFTHHLVSGLRGAADQSGDGRVTLAEAYEYAFSHTVSATAQTVVGPQHPIYDYRLAGEGELVLTELSRPAAALELPDGFDRELVIDAARDRVLAEIPKQAARRRVALTPGNYQVRAWRGRTILGGAIVVHAGETRTVWAEELHPLSATALLRAKGSGVELDDPIDLERAVWYERPLSLLMAGGAGSAAASDLGVVPVFRLQLDFGTTSGPSLAVDLATAEGPGFRETATLALVGWRLGRMRGRLSGFVGAQAGGGTIIQSLEMRSLSTPVGAVAPWMGGSVRLLGPISLTAEAQWELRFLRRDDAFALESAPAGWLGVRVGL